MRFRVSDLEKSGWFVYPLYSELNTTKTFGKALRDYSEKKLLRRKRKRNDNIIDVEITSGQKEGISYLNASIGNKH